MNNHKNVHIIPPYIQQIVKNHSIYSNGFNARFLAFRHESVRFGAISEWIWFQMKL